MNTGASTILAIDIGGTKIGWAIVADDLVVTESGQLPTQAHAGGQQVAEKIIRLATLMCTTYPHITGVAVASAGVINPRSGDIVSATEIMPGWGGIPLGALIREATKLPVQIINDVHAHGLGEAVLGAGKKHESVLSVAVGTGIGGAYIMQKQIVFGERFLAGHVGHIYHHEAAELTCSCGRNGHIEAICSGQGITNWYNFRRTSNDPEVTNGKELQDLAEEGNALARTVFEESAYALGQSLGSLINCVDASVIVLSGSMTRSGEAWWKNLHAGYRSSAMNPVRDLEILPGKLGSDAPLLGAAINFIRLEKNV